MSRMIIGANLCADLSSLYSLHAPRTAATKQKKEKNESSSLLYPLRGSTALLADAQSCARLVYTLPTSLEGRRSQGSRSLRAERVP